MSEHHVQTDVKLEDSIILETEQIISSISSITSTTYANSMAETNKSDLITSSTIPTMSQDPISCADENIISSLAPVIISQENTLEGKLIFI